MSGCCGEPDCKRKTPIALYLGALSGQVYAATRTRLVSGHGDGTGTLAAVERHDVTGAMWRFIGANPDWVREVLAREGR